MKKIKKLAVAFILAVLAAIIGINCSDRIVHNDSGMVTTQFKFNVSDAVAQLAMFRVTVSAEDFTDPIVNLLTLEGNELVGELEIPAGPARTFTIEAYDSEVNLIYQGSTTRDLVRGEPVEIAIALEPVVPIIYLTPRALDVEMGSDFVLDVKAENIEALSTLQFELDFTSESGTINQPTVEKGSTLGDSVGVSWGTGESYTTIWISLTDFRQGTGMIVDDTGYADLATLTFSTHSDTNLDLDTAYIKLSIVEAGDTLQNAITDIYPDEARVILTRPDIILQK